MKRIFYLFSAVVLVSCSKKDEGIAIPTFLEFKEVTTLEGSNLDHATGFLGSSKYNSLYIAHRAIFEASTSQPEKVSRYDLTTNELQSVQFDQTDFLTKQIHLVNDELVVLGGHFINVYTPFLEGPSRSFAHTLAITRFGSVDYQDEIYFWGGDVSFPEQDSDKLYKWNNLERTLEIIAELPTPKTWSHGEVVEDRIYIFGGREQFRDTIPSDIIYIYDIGDTAVASLHLPVPVNRTWTARHDELIYVGGHVTAEDNPRDNNIFFGVFNTRDFSFREVNLSLSDDGLSTIYQMTVVGKRLFVLYGEQQNQLQEISYSIMEADLP